MNEGRDTAKWSFKWWAGTLDQIVQAARHAANEIAELTPYPGDYDPEGPNRYADGDKRAQWQQAEAGRELSIIVSEKEGFTAHPKDLDALASMSEGAMASVDDILVFVGGTYGRPRALIKCGSSYADAMILELEGFDRTWTAGVKHELHRILKPRWRLHAPLFGNEFVVVGVAVAAFFALPIGIDQLAYHQHAWTKALRAIVSVGAGALAAGAIAGVAFASKQFELLQPGGQPRYQRWRRRILGWSGAVLLAVIGAAIWAGVSGS